MSLDWIDGPITKRPTDKHKTCPDCLGTGQDRALPIDKCIRCLGTGKVPRWDESYTAPLDVEAALGDTHLLPPDQRKKR